MSEKKLVVHGSKKKGLSTLVPPPIGGVGANGAQHGLATYSYPIERLELSMRYAEESGSIYLSQINPSEYIAIGEDQYLNSQLREALFNKIESIEDEAIKIRIATDLAGRDQRLFDSEAQADAFYDAMMEEAETYQLPDRYHPEFETDQGQFVVVSFARGELDYPDDIDVCTSDIHRSLTTISSQLATEIWSEMADGLIITDLSGGEFYAAFTPIEVIHELDSSLGADAIRQALEAIDPSKSQVLDYDLSSRNSLLYIGKDGKISMNMADVYPVEGELYIEPRPRPKIYFEYVSGEHPIVQTVIATLYRSYPDWGDAEIRFDNNPKISLAEMHAKFSNSSGESAEAGLKLYHGTSSEFLPRIAEVGLQCRDSSGVEAHYFTSISQESLPDRTYFASEFGLGAANAAARSAVSTYGGFPVILEFDVTPELMDQLAPDEDSKKLNFKESLSSMGTCAYIGNVSPHYLAIAPSRINHRIDDIKMEYAKQVLEQSRLEQGDEPPAPKETRVLKSSSKMRI